MPRKQASNSDDQAPSKTTRSRSASKKTTGGRKTATRGASENTSTAARVPRKGAAAKSEGAARKRPTRAEGPARPEMHGSASNSAGPSRTRRTHGTRPGSSNGHGNGIGVAPGKTARDYQDVKRALSTLWEDITKQTYSTFDSIAKRVERSYEDARKNVTQGDVRYALDKTQGKLKTLTNNSSQAVARLGRQARLLYEMLRDAMAGKFKMPWVTVSAITAALLYFVSPLDIIPDFIPGLGLLDDALVLSLAVSVARMDLRRYIKENDLNPAEYGL